MHQPPERCEKKRIIVGVLLGACIIVCNRERCASDVGLDFALFTASDIASLNSFSDGNTRISPPEGTIEYLSNYHGLKAYCFLFPDDCITGYPQVCLEKDGTVKSVEPGEVLVIMDSFPEV